MTPSIRNLMQGIKKGSGSSSNLKSPYITDQGFAAGNGIGGGVSGHFYFPANGGVVRCTGSQTRQSSNLLDDFRIYSR